MEQPKYTTIIHTVRINLDLSCNEYCVADMIYHLSNNPVSKIQGWCFAAKETLGEYMGMSKQSIHNLLNTLIDKGLIEKDEDTKWLRTTNKWYQAVIIEKVKFTSKESIPTVKKVYSEQSKKFTPDSKESLHNNNIDKDIDNISTKVESETVPEKSLLKESFGNNDINNLLNSLKEKNGGFIDGSEKENRQYCWLLLQKLKYKEDKERAVTTVSQIIEASQESPFHSKMATSFKYLYYNFVKIASEKKNKRTLIKL